MRTTGITNFWYKLVSHPSQVRRKHYTVVSIAGRIGFLTKAFVYAFIGGLACKSALSPVRSENESPQGVFVLIGSEPSGSGEAYLIIVLAGLALYIIWRFWEGITGQGYDPNFSRKKNFFKFRIAPLVSGTVYAVYCYYIITLLRGPKAARGSSVREEDESCFPLCWRTSVIGTIGLSILALAFTIATITQLLPAFTAKFLNEMDSEKLNKCKFCKWTFTVFGCIGFFARAVLFFMVCFLFWQIVFGHTPVLDPHHSTVSQALNALYTSSWGKWVLFFTGLGLLIYGVFAAANVYYRIFPTPPPSTTASSDVLDHRSSELPMEALSSRTSA